MLCIYARLNKYIKFSRHVEARQTGADWEWWFVGAQRSIKLRVQAKRILDRKDNYPALAYSNRYGMQIDKLLNDSMRANALPFYVFYADAEPQSVACQGQPPVSKAKRALFLSSGPSVNRLFIQPGRKQLFGNDIDLDPLK
jgi:hypothetical protein